MFYDANLEIHYDRSAARHTRAADVMLDADTALR